MGKNNCDEHVLIFLCVVSLKILPGINKSKVAIKKQETDLWFFLFQIYNSFGKNW